MAISKNLLPYERDIVLLQTQVNHLQSKIDSILGITSEILGVEGELSTTDLIAIREGFAQIAQIAINELRSEYEIRNN